MFIYKKNPAIKEYVTKKTGKKYKFQIYLGVDPVTNKKKYTTKRGFKTPALANSAYRKIEAQVKNGKYKFDATTKKTFEEIYLKWFSESYRNTVQSSTIYKTKQIFNCHILPVIGNLPISHITPEKLQPIVNDWANKYTKLNIVSRYANRVFTYAHTLSLIKTNPFDHILLPKRQKQTAQQKLNHNFLDQTELKKFTKYLLKNYTKRNTGKLDITQVAFFITLAYTGMRKGELLALNWDDINFETRKINIDKTLVMNENGKLITQPPKWQSYRIIDINSLIVKILKEYQEYSTTLPVKSKLVFPNQKGTWRNLGKPNIWLDSIITQGQADFNQIYKLTDNLYYKTFVHRITPHGLRHTHATWLFEQDNTITPKSVQQRLGHKNIAVTLDIYTHVTSNQNDKIKDALEIKF